MADEHQVPKNVHFVSVFLAFNRRNRIPRDTAEFPIDILHFCSALQAHAIYHLIINDRKLQQRFFCLPLEKKT